MPTLEARVSSLESTLRRSRLLAAALGATLTGVAVTGFAPQSQEEVATHRLVLTDAQATPQLVLVAGPDGGLLIQRPTGEEVLRIGGSPSRLLNH